MSKKTQWALMALFFANVAVLLMALVPEVNVIPVGALLGAGVAHALHGWYGCSFFPDTEVDRREPEDSHAI